MDPFAPPPDVIKELYLDILPQQVRDRLPATKFPKFKNGKRRKGNGVTILKRSVEGEGNRADCYNCKMKLGEGEVSICKGCVGLLTASADAGKAAEAAK